MKKGVVESGSLTLFKNPKSKLGKLCGSFVVFKGTRMNDTSLKQWQDLVEKDHPTKFDNAHFIHMPGFINSYLNFKAAFMQCVGDEQMAKLSHYPVNQQAD